MHKRIVCLCATYGRPKYLLDNTVECFLRQSHPNKKLLICEDADRKLSIEDHPDIEIMHIPRVHLSVKYPIMCTHVIEEADIFAVWDDDDIYLPNHLTQVAKSLEEGQWCRPSKGYFFSGSLKEVKAYWHATMAMTKEAHLKCGWELDEVKNFDTRVMNRLSKEYGKAIDSLGESPTFIYRWSNTGNARHSSGHLSKEGSKKYNPQNTEDVMIEPKLDEKALELEHLFI